MNTPTASFSVNVDPTNPGQFFACCGLLELADRLWPGTVGWFADSQFFLAGNGKLCASLSAAQSVKFSDKTESDTSEEDGDNEDDEDLFEPLLIVSPFELRLDWWRDKTIKTWAGSMKVGLIAKAMSHAIDFNNPNPFNQGQIVFDPPRFGQNIGGGTKRAKLKKREPFCFDSRRGSSSRSIDTGFSTNDLKLMTTSFPAVEFFCLLGLQRCRPIPTNRPRHFTYHTWSWPCPTSLLPAAVTGLVHDRNSKCFRFENAFRSGQKKHKAYRSAVPLSPVRDQQ